MATYEQTVRRLASIAPDMSFKEVIRLAEEAEQHSKDISLQNYTLLLLLELIGFTDNGDAPDWLKDRIVKEKNTEKQLEYMFAVRQAQRCHGGHACGIPGYKQSMSSYNAMFLHHQFHLRDSLKSDIADYKAKLDNTSQ